MNIYRIKEAIAEAGISYDELAQKVGITPTSISRIANGVQNPRGETLLKIAEVLDVDVRELLVPTKAKDLSDPVEALKEIKKISNSADL